MEYTVLKTAHVKMEQCVIVSMEHAIVQQDGKEIVVILHVHQGHTD